MTTLPDAKLFIDGKLRDAAGGRTYDIISPWTGEVVGKAADASAEDVNEAIAAARRAFDETNWGSDENRQTRFELVKKYRELFEQNRDRLAALAVHEAGAAQGAVFRAHVNMALDGWDDYLAVFPKVEWEKDYGEKEAFGSIHKRVGVREPVGVVGAITPWNVPLYVNIGKVVAALLAGCTVILKPAPNTPGMGAIFGELAKEAGFPDGVINVVFGADPALAGEMLVTDPRVDLISFTGSTGVGKRIMEQGAATLKRVFLELGGKSAKIVLDDAPNFAMEVGMTMLVFHAGQGCAVQSRLLVPRSRYEEAKAILKGAYGQFGDNWGDVDNPAHIMGPVISKRQMDRVMSYIELGKEEGATLLVGGHARPDKGGGYFIEPTCFVDVTNDMRIAQEEIFGPVLVVIPFEDDDDAVRIANESSYGLSGGVSSGDHERAVRVAKRVRTGSVSVNNGMCIAGDIPFGGYKASGIGREWGVEGIEEYTDVKMLAWPVGQAQPA
ncbi:aldehyde dehydrogenase family protein [Novosphingobium album (ex Liu et al. 2023)]|uniref:Aldehyde dehydrogenase family protein n=1 Tax=Novosphingobium album (ex Liu et al. 2023) TaxID=3031130 RepID=A0ABT5WU95_9SPHN|nr:aldehyde dehydrogenase family protein [Novosphingobium album (ex Liu et al. 2023)]MDE8653475.1 aldehyde dehydrogenase family protein [Novosphingobium album (ex Liu et al. 2023)]